MTASEWKQTITGRNRLGFAAAEGARVPDSALATIPNQPMAAPAGVFSSAAAARLASRGARSETVPHQSAGLIFEFLTGAVRY